MALSTKVLVQGEARDQGLAFDIVTKVEIRSALSRLFEVVVEVHHPDPALDLDAVVGRNVFVDFPEEPFLKKLDGIVREARQLTAEPGFVSVYELVIAPPHWLLGRRRDCRIFQHLTVPDIVSAVLDGYGGSIPSRPLVSTLHAPEAREYCVQYEETDHDFVFRILAEEGLVWLHDHHQGTGAPGERRDTNADDVTLLDDTRAQPVHCSVEYNPAANLSSSASQAEGRTRPEIYHVAIAAGVETSRVTLGDYNYENPAVVLRETARETKLSASETELETYDYEVGRFRDSAPGAAAAERDLRATRAGRKTFLCKSSFLLAPGTRFSLKSSPWGDLDLLVVGCDASWSFRQDSSSAQLSTSLLCIPAAVPFRPKRLPRPRIYGTQTAFVVGKKAGQDEIDVDASGRVKVHFNWDRRKTSFEGVPTRYIRVSQPWAGQGHGMTLVPRVGDELVIAFLDGDPDEPIVVGRVHNPIYPDPLNFADPDQHTISTWKSKSSPRDPSSSEDRYNLVMMQDKSGEELLKLRAQRDFEHDTLHDSRTFVGHDQTIQVVGGQSTSAGSISMSSGSTITESAKTDFKMNAGASMSLDAGTDMSLHAAGALKATAGQKIEATSPTVLVKGEGICSVHGGNLHLHGEGNTFVSAGALVNVAGAQVQIVAGGSTVTLTKGGDVIIAAAASVQITASGTVTVKGGEVDLNC
jgi:type VI secretion system secreted protein VgrG